MLVEETAEVVVGLSRWGHPDPAELLTACRRVLSQHPVDGPLWWMSARVLTATDVRVEVAELLDELAGDRTPVELEAALPHGATVTVVGWCPQVAVGLIRRGDLTVQVVDAMGEGHQVAQQLAQRGVDTYEVPPEAVAGAVRRSEVVLVEAAMAGPDEALCVTGTLPTAAVARHLGVPVWLAAGIGYRLPQALYDTASARWRARRGGGGDGLRLAGPEPSALEPLGVALVDRVLCEVGLLDAPPIPGAPNFPRAPELERLGVVSDDPTS